MKRLFALLIALPAFAADLSWSTFFGGTAGNSAFVDEAVSGIAVDRGGSVYVTGWTNSTNYPVTPGALQGSASGNDDAFVTKFLPDGTGLAWSTYLGGSGQDKAMRILLDTYGNAYVLGTTDSSQFPSTAGDRPSCPCWFVVKLSGITGALLYSRVSQGGAADMAVADDLGVYVTGSADGDAFVYKLDANGNFAWRRTFGGSQQDAGTAIAVTPAGTAVVVGQTESTDFPTTDGAYQRELGGFAFFVTRFSPDGSAIISSTLFGGPNPNTGGRVALDAFGNAYVTGNARDSYLPWSTLDLRLSYRDFLAKFTPAGGLVWVIPIGDGGLRNSLAVDAAGEAYLAGSSLGIDPRVATADAVQSVAYCDSHYGNAFLIRINSAGDMVSYGTYLGGTVWDYAAAVAIDGQGNVYLAGEALSPDFPTTPGTFQPTRVGQEFVAKIDMATKPAVALQAVLNGASFLGGPLVPGELVTLFGDGLGPDTGLRAEATDGALPTELGSTSVIVDGTPAPLLYVSRKQINAIVPFAAVDRTTHRTRPPIPPNADLFEVVVCAAAGCSNAVRLSVVPQHIAVFTRDASGAGQVDIGGGAAELLYAGTAPGMVAGVAQVNVRVPPDGLSGQTWLRIAAPRFNPGLVDQNVTVSVE